MTARLHLAPSAPPVSPEISSGGNAGSHFDAWAYKRAFPDKWAAFLRAHFQSSEHVAVFFSVSEKAARDWLNGVSGPRGAHVGHAYSVMPQAAIKHLSEAA